MGGKSSGRQIVGWRFAGPSGSRAKGQPPATGDCRHGRFLGDDARRDALKRSAIVFPVFGIAPQEFPGEPRAIESQAGMSDTSVAAQQLAVTASHHADRVFHETDRLTADGGCLPRIARDGLGAVERVGDLTIARVGEVSVEGADHQGETLAMTPGDLPCLWQRTGGTPGQTSLEADEAENANPKIIIQRQQGCELLICSNVAKPQVVVARRVLDDDMGAVCADGARPRRAEIDAGKFSSLRIAVRRSDKDNGGWQMFGPPDRRVEVCWPVSEALRPGPPRCAPKRGKCRAAKIMGGAGAICDRLRCWGRAFA